MPLIAEKCLDFNLTAIITPSLALLYYYKPRNLSFGCKNKSARVEIAKINPQGVEMQSLGNLLILMSTEIETRLVFLCLYFTTIKIA